MQDVTEKLKIEAIQAGLELINPGRNPIYRTYKWISCGHVQEYQTSLVRSKSIQCKQCIEEKLQTEAKNAGLIILSAGKNKNLRYQWISCGHVAESQPGNVRAKGIRCQQCLDENLRLDALSAGLVIFGNGKNAQYRKCQWVGCGHINEYLTNHLKAKSVRCQECLDIKLVEEAKTLGLKIIGLGKTCNFKMYQFESCGHIQEQSVKSIRDGYIRCRECLNSRLYNEAKDAGLLLLEKGKDKNYRKYQWLNCGHIIELTTSSVRQKKINCEHCFQEKLERDAELVGLDFIGAGRTSHFRKYQWKLCGHIQEYATSCVREGSIRCQQCLVHRSGKTLTKERASVSLVTMHNIFPERSPARRKYCGSFRKTVPSYLN